MAKTEFTLQEIVEILKREGAIRLGVASESLEVVDEQEDVLNVSSRCYWNTVTVTDEWLS